MLLVRIVIRIEIRERAHCLEHLRHLRLPERLDALGKHDAAAFALGAETVSEFSDRAHERASQSAGQVSLRSLGTFQCRADLSQRLWAVGTGGVVAGKAQAAIMAVICTRAAGGAGPSDRVIAASIR